MLYHI